MKLGYPVRLARYAFLIGLVALVLVGAIVFSLNVVTERTENFQAQLSGRFQSSEVPEPDESPTPEPSPAPRETHAVLSTREINRRAARRTLLMLRPMAYYLLGTGLLWGLASLKKQVAYSVYLDQLGEISDEEGEP